MKTTTKFKQQPFEQRSAESLRILKKYGDRYIPVIVENRQGDVLPPLDKNKFLVPIIDMTVGHFIYVIRSRMKLSPDRCIFLFVNNQLPPTSKLISVLYQEEKDKDGFLYMICASESVFG